MIWGAMASSGVGPFCFIKKKVNALVYQDILQHFTPFFTDELFGDTVFYFQQDLVPVYRAEQHELSMILRCLTDQPIHQISI